MSENSNELLHAKNVAYFAQYGKNFQEKILQGLIFDHNWSMQMSEVMLSHYFDVRYLEYLAEKFFNYFGRYKCFPTLSLLVSIVREDLSGDTDDILKNQIVEYLCRIKSNPNSGDLQYVKDKSLDFCKRQIFKEALEKSVELISSDNFESVVGIMRDAVAVGMSNTTGHDFFEDVEARFVKHQRQACPTGLRQIDGPDILRGGLGRGELGVVTANTGVGKSHWLVAMGANAMQVGKNVIHYTFELSEHAVGLRYDSNLCAIASNDVQDHKDEVFRIYEQEKLGRLIIKEYPTGSASVITIRNHVDKLLLKGFTPSLIIVDYADIMRSTRSFDSLRHELKLVYEELRNMAMDMGIPIWTASQANRDSANSDIVGLENMAEAYGKAMVADVVVSLSRKATEKSTGAGRLFIAKNRAGKDGLVFPIHIDTAMSRIEILDETSLTLNEAVSADENSMKNLLKQKWKELNSTSGD